ncbi:hypothetical protein BZA77DRAFT_295466 [Pyronema omphalodes]|nr:hypothetical protein BZA77DRAFT_295466 [Pyronema omphalodes]
MSESDEYQPVPSSKSDTSDSSECDDAAYTTWSLTDNDISVDPEEQHDPDSSEIDYPDTSSSSSSCSESSEDGSERPRYRWKQYSPPSSENSDPPRQRRIIPINARTSNPPQPRSGSVSAPTPGPRKGPRVRNLHRPNNRPPPSEQMDISASLVPAGSINSNKVDGKPDRMEVTIAGNESSEPSGIQTPNSLSDPIPTSSKPSSSSKGDPQTSN